MESTASPAANRTRPRSAPRRGFDAARAFFGGGVDGNEQLTAMMGVILILLFAVLGVTILRIGQLIWLHLFLGLLLLGPVLLKMVSTGYRFARYYLRKALYVAKGPPVLALRAMGPLLVISTVVVFASGIVLMFDGPRGRATPLLIHKASFIVWLALFGLHLLAHVPGLPHTLRAVRLASGESSSLDGLGSAGDAGRWVALLGALVGGVVLAVVLIPHFSLWTAPGAFPHHHHDG
jgi:hypothetical protein